MAMGLHGIDFKVVNILHRKYYIDFKVGDCKPMQLLARLDKPMLK